MTVFPSTAQVGSEGCALVQRRVANLGLVLALVGIAFVIMRVVAVLAVGRPEKLISTSMVVHYAGVCVSLGMWLSCRQGAQSIGRSYGIEFVGLLATCGLYAVMAAGIPQAFRPEMTILLAFGVFLLAHAVHVPGTWQWTVLLGFGLAAPLFLGAWVILTPMDPRLVAASASAPGSVQTTAASIVGIGMASVVTWWAVIVTTAAAGSSVIHGLRREVRQLGQYVIEEKLGEGGMGVVYRAKHAMLRRPTAIKLLLPERVGEESLARFEREVRATARLTHPNTVTIYDYGRTSEGRFYYAMELLNGASLAEVVNVAGPMPAARVVHILRQVTGALKEAHDLGLIHRDIKPANVMLTTQGGVQDVAKVVDFGLVKRVDGTTDPSLTSENVTVGTPLYLAPEVINGSRDDSSRDLYALGCVAYFLLTGDNVFSAPTTVEVCSMHLFVDPEAPSARLGTEIPDDLETLVLDLLQKKAEDRPPTAAVLLERLDACRDIELWTQADAARWWQRWDDQLRKRQRDHAPVTESGAVALTVDVGHRAAHGGTSTPSDTGARG